MHSGVTSTRNSSCSKERHPERISKPLSHGSTRDTYKGLTAARQLLRLTVSEEPPHPKEAGLLDTDTQGLTPATQV